MVKRLRHGTCGLFFAIYIFCGSAFSFNFAQDPQSVLSQETMGSCEAELANSWEQVELPVGSPTSTHLERVRVGQEVVLTMNEHSNHPPPGYTFSGVVLKINGPYLSFDTAAIHVSCVNLERSWIKDLEPSSKRFTAEDYETFLIWIRINNATSNDWIRTETEPAMVVSPGDFDNVRKLLYACLVNRNRYLLRVLYDNLHLQVSGTEDPQQTIPLGEVLNSKTKEAIVHNPETALSVSLDLRPSK